MATRRRRSGPHGLRPLRVLPATAVLLLVIHTAASPTAQRLSEAGRLPGEGRGVHQAAISWPGQGQAALALGDGRLAASPHQRPAPIASLAKVMTAYVTLERYPLGAAEPGFAITVDAAQAQAEAREAAQGASVVPVQAGEQLTERQLLEAMLVPSGNNIAKMLAAAVDGSETSFLSDMNAYAHRLGMLRTVYTDPSGFDPHTVSTAADQLRLLLHAERLPAFRRIVSLASVTLPLAGTVRNFNPLVTDGYAGKTGSDSQAGGCLAFFTHALVGTGARTVSGVVMGQGEGSDTSAILAAAGEAARRMVASISR